ncbi:hypothetical protein LCGC14_2107430 [marine sediment metagenome]|uniref:Uncharacterized protein n=1 Tax=marine sediment metagenome TaxID=412755 RepID=A0A0F9GL93_9ZZZZ
MTIKELKEIVEDMDDKGDVVFSIGQGTVIIGEILTAQKARTPDDQYQRLILRNSEKIQDLELIL